MVEKGVEKKKKNKQMTRKMENGERRIQGEYNHLERFC